MRWLLLAGLAAFGYWLHQRTTPDVSHAWRIDHERRRWGKGHEGISWKWPYQR